MNTGEHSQTLTGHVGEIRTIIFSADGRIIASTGEDSTLRFWDLNTYEQQRGLTAYQGTLWNVLFRSDGSTIVTETAKTLVHSDLWRKIRLWNYANGKQIKIIHENYSSIWSIVFSPDGKLMASSGMDCIVYLWDLSVLLNTDNIIE